ncbi:hypothetical protein [Sphingomonas liriopis]|nr:hypothetical protein [Sphingomonas liriopis]
MVGGPAPVVAVMMPEPQSPLREDQLLIVVLVALALIWAVWP